MINFTINAIGLEVKLTGYNYKIDIMNNGIIIGTLSGRNVSSEGGVAGPAPVNTVLPVISDTTPTVGQTLTTTNGSWSNSPSSYAYQWNRNSTPIIDGTGIASSYLVVSADYNLPLTCTITATNANGSTTATSSATSNVIPLAPTNSSIPIITGISTTGSTLTCSTGTWSSQGTPTYGYQWTKDGSNIGGQTSSTYLVNITDEDHYIGCKVIATNAGGASSSSAANDVYITDPSLSSITSNHVYSGSDRMLVYTPPGYTNNLSNYPVILFYHGNGERGVAVDSSTLAGTGNGVTTVFSGNLSNTDKIIHTSAYVTVNGVQVATGRYGVFSGTGVTGTYAYDDGSSAAFSLTFTSPPTNTYPIRIYFTQDELLAQGSFEYLNLGDQPGLTSNFDNCIIAAPQISRGSGGFADTEWTNALNYLTTNFRINTNRIYTCGFSLGADMCSRVMNSLGNDNSVTTYEFAAFVATSPGSNSDVSTGASGNFQLASNKGKLFYRGTSEGAGIGDTKITSLMANGNGIASIEFPIQAFMAWGSSHSGAVVDSICYNRKDRTDTTGTAAFDYIKWLLRFSLDPEEQATLFVRYAESTENHIDYRLAKRQVDNLSSGTTKTTLTANLVTLKALIGKAILIDFGTSGKITSGNYNNVTSAATGTFASPLNMLNDDGTNSGISLQIITASAATPATISDLGSNRSNGRAFGLEYNTNVDGHLVDDIGTTGTYAFTGTNNTKTYTLRIYVMNAGNTWTTRAEAEATFGGVTKYFYCQLNNAFYIEFTGLVSSGSTFSGTIKQRLTASTEKLFYLQAMELIEE